MLMVFRTWLVFPLGSMPDRVSLILFPLQPIFCRVLTNGWTIIGPKNKSSSGCSYLSFMPASAYLMVIWGKNIIPLTIIPSKALGSLHPYQKTFSNFTLWYLHFQIWKIKWWFWVGQTQAEFDLIFVLSHSNKKRLLINVKSNIFSDEKII